MDRSVPVRRALVPLLSFLLLSALLPALAAPPAAGGQAAPDTAYLAKLPPLLDRQLFFGNPEIAGAQLSPDGRWMTFLKEYRGELNVWIKRREEPFEKARPLTADTERPVRGYFWTRDSRYVLYVQDRGGNENFHVWRVDPTAKPGPDGVPPAVDLTPCEKAQARILSLPRKDPGTIVVALNDRDPSYHDVYRVDVATGKRTLLYKNDGGYAGFLCDLDGNVRLGFRMTEDGGSETVELVPGREPRVLLSCSFEENCAPVRFTPDGKSFWFASNHGEDVDLVGLYRYDLAKGEAIFVESDPEKEVDLASPVFSERTDELVATVYVGDRARVYPKTREFRRDYEWLKKHLPDGEIGIGSRTADERYWIVSIHSDVNPGSAYLWDRKKRRLRKLYDARPELPRRYLAPMKPVRYRARDGLVIPAYLTVPKGVPAKNLPAIVLPHGGPWARDHWGYDPFAQFLANRGYAVLQPNFRGSTGYGKKFLNAGNGEWGTGAMQHDLTDGARWLIEQGIADPHRVAIMGGSYGGYATLAGLAFTPDVYAAGVDIVGPSNILTLLDSIPAYWKPIRQMFYRRVGNPEDPRDRERLIAQSPLFSAKKIRAPLLVIQGANDPRVKKRESDQIVVALRDLGRPVEYLVAPDEGHGYAREENRLAMIVAIERFLAKHLHGRVQEDVRPEIAQRLEEITVDVSKVTLPEKPSGADAAMKAAPPSPRKDVLVPMNLAYTTTVRVPGGQSMEVEATRRVAQAKGPDGKPAWRVDTSARTPMGEAEDTWLLDGETLLPIHRALKQGPVTIELDFTAEKVTGKISTPQGEVPVDVALPAPVVGDEAALGALLAALPWKAGYETTVRTFDVQRQKVRPWKLEAVGEETVTVPAGEFACWKVSLSPLDDDGGGGFLWIAKEKPLVVLTGIRVPTPMGTLDTTTRLTKAE